MSIFLSNLGKDYWETVKSILRYLKGISKLCLCFGVANLVLEGYFDSDMTRDLDGGKCTSRLFLFTFVGGVVSWWFKL